jgi:hypothetical protein
MAATAAAVFRPHAQAAAEPGFNVGRTVAGFVFVAGSLCALCIFLGVGFALFFAIPVLVAWFWRAPVRGVYVLVAGAVLVEVFPLNFPDSLTDRVQMFLNLNNSAGLTGFPITPAEILMLAAVVVAVARGASERQLHWPGGKLLIAYLIFVLVVLGAEVHGLVTRGDLNTSLWEMRPQVYGFILFFLATTLVKDRDQLKTLGLVLLLAVSTKALIGVVRYYITLHGSLGPGLQVLAHEDSYFLGMFITAALAGAIWLRNRRFVFITSLGSVLALVAMLANSRRAGVFALAGAVAVVVLLAYRFEPQLRKRIAWLCVAAVIGGFVFLSYGWDKQYGVQAQLVRPVRSLVDPTARDLSSDLYRTAELTNLRITYRTSPIIGVGFGSPFYVVAPMADISMIYPLWKVIPHNSLMWIGMRMGAIGFMAFWGFIGLAVLAGFDVMRARRDPLIRATAAFALAAIAAEIAVGYSDIQLESYRNLIFLGVVLGVLNRLPRLDDAGEV